VRCKSSALVVQHLDFYGCHEDIGAAARIVHEASALLLVVADPV